jgi:hypothetical protein
MHNRALHLPSAALGRACLSSRVASESLSPRTAWRATRRCSRSPFRRVGSEMVAFAAPSMWERVDTCARSWAIPAAWSKSVAINASSLLERVDACAWRSQMGYVSSRCVEGLHRADLKLT